MADLDDLKSYRELDREGMGKHLRRLPQQCLQAWQRAMEFPLPPGLTGVERVVVTGMGGSAVGGDLLRDLARLQGKRVVVHRDYPPLPALDPQTLVIFSSYSGETEETLACLEASRESPAKKLVFTSGGKLAEMALRQGIPVFPIDYPAPPRAVIGYSFIGLLGLLQRLGFLSDHASQVEGMVAVLEQGVERLKEERLVNANPAKELATRLKDRLVLIYGGGFLDAVARRWKTQLNENSKASAFAESLPELNHNSVVGYPFPPFLAGGSFVVMLTSPLLHPRLRLRYQITGELLTQEVIPFTTVSGEGGSPLSQMMSLILVGDYVSYYLAVLNGVDPSPTPPINYLKERLAEHGFPAQS